MVVWLGVKVLFVLIFLIYSPRRYAFDLLLQLLKLTGYAAETTKSQLEKMRPMVVGLLSSEFACIRGALSQGIRDMCRNLGNHEGNVNVWWRDALLGYLPNIEPDSKYCAEFFQLVCSLCMDGHQRLFLQDDCGDTILLPLLSLIESHPCMERTAEDHDEALLGLLNLASVLFRLNPKNAPAIDEGQASLMDEKFGPDLVREIYGKCLFADDMGEKLVKCKSPALREAAFKTLGVVASYGPNSLRTLFELVHFAHLGMPSHKNEWNLGPDESRSSCYVGLRNLGCTCYMNSLLQQLFMIPGFADSILKANDPEVIETNTSKPVDPPSRTSSTLKRELWDEGQGSDVDLKREPESLLYQLQKVVLNLKQSDESFFDPSSFVHSFKGWDNAPINVNVQMDVHEFWSMLFDRLEEKLKIAGQPDLLHEAFGGVVANEFICRGCPHRFTREEKFSYLSIDVKHNESISQGLEQFCQGEMLAGSNAYNCSTCKKKVDTLKRTVVQRLPSTLVLHLKRFEFNLETMRKQKLNDRCTFPMTLNMLPYTVDGLVSAESLQQQLQQQAPSSPAGQSQAEAPDQSEPAKANTEHNQKSNANVKEVDDKNFLYELVGVLVHSGQADHGHYYSFIKGSGHGKCLTIIITQTRFSHTSTHIGHINLHADLK